MTEPSERDVRALLAGLDAGPLPELDVDAVMRGGRRYRRRQTTYRSVASLAVVLVAIGIVAGVARLSAGPAPRPVTSPTPASSPGPTGSPSPSGWAAPNAAASFTLTGSMGTARVRATATLLADGTVLVVGGRDSEMLASAELYGPSSGAFAPTGSMISAGDFATATLLADGKVLIAGGIGQTGDPSMTQLYDPTTGTFSATGPMRTPRWGATATLLPNGTVLIAGGTAGGSAGGWLSSAELYDPGTGRFTTTGSMRAARMGATATLLGDGRVLIAGGEGAGGQTVSSAELYDPATGAFTVTGSLHTPREDATATLLPNGQVLIAGGQATGRDAGTWSSAELYDSGTGIFTPTGSLSEPRAGATATLLPDGRVLIAGGTDSGSGNGILSSAELYDPAAGSFTPTVPMRAARMGATATLLGDGRVLIAGGAGRTGVLSSAELYQPGSGATTSPSPATQSSASSGLACSAADLTARQTGGGSVASQPFSIITLTNSSDHQCTLHGYPTIVGVSDTPADPSASLGSQPLAVVDGGLYEVPDPGPTEFTLPPGGHAWFALGTGTGYAGPLVTITEVHVATAITPANGPAAVAVPVSLAATMPPGQPLTITVTAFAAGTGP